MKVLVLSVACGDGSPAETDSALRTIKNFARRMEERGSTPYLFEIPDNATKYRVMVVGEVPVVQEDCCPVCGSDWKGTHEPGCERGMR